MKYSLCLQVDSEAELNYNNVGKEASAVISAIKIFRHYLLDEPFSVNSDHIPLQLLQNQKYYNSNIVYSI